MTCKTFIAMLQKNTLMPPACTGYRVLPFKRRKKHEIQGNSALEETGKGAAGVNVANVAVGDTDILFPLSMSAEKYLR